MGRRGIENIQRDGKPVAPPRPGEARALKHGMYGTVVHSEAVAEIAADLRQHAPLYHESHEPLIESTALLICRVRTQFPDPPKPGTRKSADLRGMQAELRRHLAELGMSPMAMARLGVDLSRTEPSLVRRMQEEAAE
jgi:hypothetical protein